jgi:hypothetical protein
MNGQLVLAAAYAFRIPNWVLGVAAGIVAVIVLAIILIRERH